MVNIVFVIHKVNYNGIAFFSTILCYPSLPILNIGTMFAESLKSLMKDEMRRNKLAIKGLETCRRFNIETVVDRWEEIFEKMR